MITFKEKLNTLFDDYNKLITSKNVPLEDGNGILTRYKYPILTAAHTPVFWRYDLDSESNPYLMERIGMNATMNAGAIKWNGKYLLMVRRLLVRLSPSVTGATSAGVTFLVG